MGTRRGKNASAQEVKGRGRKIYLKLHVRISENYEIFSKASAEESVSDTTRTRNSREIPLFSSHDRSVSFDTG